MRTQIHATPLRAIVFAAVCVACAAARAAAASPETGSAIDMPMRAIPLGQLREGEQLVAGERLSVFWDTSSSLRPAAYARKAGGPWRLVRLPDPTPNGLLRREWRLPANLAGPMELRFSAEGADLGSFHVTVAASAGSPGMGPVLDAPLESFGSGEQPDRNFIPHRTAEELADAQYRLFVAEGGRKCLPEYPALANQAMADSRRFAGGVPILPSRVVYHYRDPASRGLRAAEFRGLGFPISDVASNHVVFVLGDAYLFSNVADPIARVELRIGMDTLDIKRNGQREYAFATDGLQTVFLRAVTLAGVVWEQAAVIDVKSVAEAAEQPAESGDTGTATTAVKPPRTLR